MAKAYEFKCKKCGEWFIPEDGEYHSLCKHCREDEEMKLMEHLHKQAQNKEE